ncbi:MAG: hypothetical protein ABSF84_00600 [Acidimicrobiales bacterium]
MDDDPLAGWETADDLLQRGRALDPNMTRTKLTRLHKTGLLPRPVVRNRIGTRGRETFYPPGAGDRLDQVLKVRQSDRRFGEAAWKIWWQGSGSPSDARPLLDKTASNVNKIIAKVRSYLDDSGALTDAGEDLLEQSSSANLRGAPLGWLRKRLAFETGGTDAFEGALLVIMRVIRGDEITDDDARTFEQAIGLDRARNYTFSGQSAWPPAGSMLDSLLWMAKMLAVPFAADEMTDEELDAARLDTQQFLGLFANMELPMRKLFGRWGPGFTFIGHLAKWMLSSPGNQAMAVLLFHRLRTEPAFQPGMEELRPTANEWTGHRRFWESLEQMSRDIPALGRVVTYPRLRAAMRSEAGQRQLAQVIHEVRTDHGDEIDRYIADHPELTFPRQDESAAVSSDDPEGVDGGTL